MVKASGVDLQENLCLKKKRKEKEREKKEKCWPDSPTNGTNSS